MEKAQKDQIIEFKGSGTAYGLLAIFFILVGAVLFRFGFYDFLDHTSLPILMLAISGFFVIPISMILSGSKDAAVKYNLGWYPERVLISNIFRSLYTKQAQRLSVTMIM